MKTTGFLSDLHGSALVSRGTSVDWLCIPRFDSGACMAALLGRDEHGRWSTYPLAEVRGVKRRYRAGALILGTAYLAEVLSRAQDHPTSAIDQLLTCKQTLPRGKIGST